MFRFALGVELFFVNQEEERHDLLKDVRLGRSNIRTATIVNFIVIDRGARGFISIAFPLFNRVRFSSVSY